MKKKIKNDNISFIKDNCKLFDNCLSKDCLLQQADIISFKVCETLYVMEKHGLIESKPCSWKDLNEKKNTL